MKTLIPTFLVPLLAVSMLPTLSQAGGEKAMPWTTPPSVYLGFGSPCEVFAGEWWNAGERRSFPLRAVCGLPEQAVAVLLEVRSEALEGQSPAVKLWAGGLAEPAAVVLPGMPGRVGAVQRGLTLVPLCTEGCGAEEVSLHSDATAYLDVAVVGYFRSLGEGSDSEEAEGAEALLRSAMVDEGEWLQPLATEGPNNNFFGEGAGASNSTGIRNSFFGGNAGNKNTSGNNNSFFGYFAGVNNTTGFDNAFFGANSGVSNTTGHSNTFYGYEAGTLNTEGRVNSFFGTRAGASNTTGFGNAFFGEEAGLSNTTGVGNTFVGRSAGRDNSTGNSNAFFGAGAGFQNTTGSENAFFGVAAGSGNTSACCNAFFGHIAGSATTTGSNNAFFGHNAGRWNTTGNLNAFFGREAGFNNTTGFGNAFFGRRAGYNNINGNQNAFFGENAGFANTTGFGNAFFGDQAGLGNTTGRNNAFFGSFAGYGNWTGNNNVFVGHSAGLANTAEGNNTFVGSLTNGVTGIDNATALGHRAQVSQSNSLVLGSIAGENGALESVNVGIGVSAPERQLHLSGPNAQIRIDRPVDATSFQLVRTTAAGDVLKSFVFGVLASGPDNGSFFIRDNAQQTGGATDRVRMQINNAGNTTFQGTVSAVAFNSTSSARFKTDVTALAEAGEALQQLRGVRFNWKESGAPSLGLIAEEVAEVFPELVQFDAETGAAQAVNYAALVAVLIEGFKTQQGQLEVQTQLLDAQAQHAARQDQEIEGYQSRVVVLEQQQALQAQQLAAQQQQLTEMVTLRAQVAAIERLLEGGLPALAQR